MQAPDRFAGGTQAALKIEDSSIKQLSNMSNTAKALKAAKAEKAAPAPATASPATQPVRGGGAVKKVVLAYSGGLDTSIILKWLQDEYGCEVVTFTADIGQGEEIEPARAKAIKMGIKPENIFIEDLREEFVRDFVFPMFRANALYEGEYLLGTSIARPLIAKRLIDIAKKTKGDAISHGATGKGNDQVRFELGAYALLPGVKVIAPWREWDLLSRDKLLAYADKHGIPVDFKKRKGGAPYSMDANLLHISYEGGVLEDPNFEPEANMWRLTVSPEKAPNKPQVIELTYAKGDVVAIDGVKMSPATVLTKLNEIGGKHGIGRLDKVENRYVGMKSRGCYETPGGTILLSGHRAIESITLDREVLALKDDLMPRYARMVYNGYWFSPERELLQGLIDASQVTVNGTVKLKLYKGTILVVGRESKTDSLFDAKISTFDDDGGAYNQADAAGFIKLNALRLRIGANVKAKREAAAKPARTVAQKTAVKKAAIKKAK
jgi:argininosuccinate synthase